VGKVWRERKKGEKKGRKRKVIRQSANFARASTRSWLLAPRGQEEARALRRVARTPLEGGAKL